MDITVIIASIVVFLAITFVLVGMLLGVKARLMPSGPVKLFINGETDVEVSSGSTLLSTPAVEEVPVSSVSVSLKTVEVKFFQRKSHTFQEKRLPKAGVWVAKSR
jgi:Na+-transporting NADH:ubiquinone oxidoreductase subunit NqrF